MKRNPTQKNMIVGLRASAPTYEFFILTTLLLN